jgi:outer membrane biosynthesis protein TonB
MKATDMLNKVKEVLGVELSEVPLEVKLAQAELENGTIIESENFEAGAEVFIVTEDEKVAMPVGEYKLVDGESLIVEEEGIIASIGAVEEAPEEEVEAEKKEEMGYATKQELQEVKEMVEEIKSMLEPKEEMAEEPVEENSVKSEETTTKTVYAEKEDLSEVQKVTHNPEKENKPNLNLYSQKRTNTTLDRVLNKISNIK